MANQTERLLHEARAGLSDLHKTLGRAVRVAQTPDDPELLEIDRKIDEQRRLIERLERMAEAGKVAESEEAIRAQIIARRAAVKKAGQLARDRIKLARQIDTAVAALGPLLAEWEAQGKECASNAAVVNRDLSAGWQYAMLNAARGNDGRFATALDWAMHRAGLTERGITSDVTVRRPLGDPYTLEQAATLVAERLQAQLDNLADIADKEAAL